MERERKRERNREGERDTEMDSHNDSARTADIFKCQHLFLVLWEFSEIARGGKLNQWCFGSKKKTQKAFALATARTA